MAFQTFKEWPTDGVTTTFSWTVDELPYLTASDIKVYLDSVLQTTGFTKNAYSIVFTIAPTSGQTLRVQRITDNSEVDHLELGSTPSVAQMDSILTRVQYLAQEAADVGGGGILPITDTVALQGTQIDTLNTAVPSITGKATNMLRVNAGGTAGEWRTPTQVRTDLGLGALALLASVATANIDANAVTPAKFEAKKLVGSYFEIGNVQAAGGNGGTATTGSTQTLPINTEISDGDNLVSIASNDFTITGAGAFNLEGFQNFYAGASNSNSEIELYNVTDAAVVTTVYCMPSWAAGAGNTQVTARIFGRFSQSGTKTYRLRYRVGATQASTGLGIGTGSNSLVHGYFKFVKES